MTTTDDRLDPDTDLDLDLETWDQFVLAVRHARTQRPDFTLAEAHREALQDWIALTAVDAGLGALFFGISPTKIADVREAFGVPERFQPIGVVAVGYPLGATPSQSLRRGRRPGAEVVHRGRW